MVKTYALLGTKFSSLTNHILEVGDYVEADEEIATIETDKVCAGHD